MNEWSFILGVGMYIGLISLRFLCSFLYVKKHRKQRGEIDESDYTIVQPILSGDPALEERLRANLLSTSATSFLWLIDKADHEAKHIAERILRESFFAERTTCLFMEEVPQGVNPKVYKLKQAVDNVQTTYMIVLDDDSVIDQRYFKEMAAYEQREDEWLITGIPYNDAITPFFSRLVAAFVNSQSHLTYFGIAHLGQMHTINGMFYIAKTTLFKKYDVFEEIEAYLCDDYELARFLRHKGVQLIQSTIPCQVQTTVSHLREYIGLMKRWLVFSNYYMREHLSLTLLFYMMLPSVWPIMLIVWGFIMGYSHVLVVCLVLFVKALANQWYRKWIYQRKEGISAVATEVLSDLVLPLLYLYALARPYTIRWRNRKITIKGRALTYE